MPIDYKRYPANWKTEIVPAIMKRCGKHCEVCGLGHRQLVWSVKLDIKTNGRYNYQSVWFSSYNDALRESQGSVVKPVTVILTVAHLDHDEENHSVTLHRLKAMCQICHLRYDAKEKYRRSLKGK